MSGVAVPAPTGGWNSRDALAEMPVTDAVTLENIVPNGDSLKARPGYSAHSSQLESGAAIQTLVTYHGATETLFCAVNGKVIDITAGGTGTTRGSGFSSDKWYTAEFKNRIIFCSGNGTDGVQDWDGSTWTATSISGATSADLIHPCNFKGRMFYVEANSQSVWYMGAGSYAGAATELDLSQFTTTGGDLLYMIDWTMDGGSGVDDYAVFVFDTGEILVYAGSDPGSATDWALLGRFKIGEPLGRRSATQVGGDVIILTRDGYVPLSAALAEGRYTENSNFSFKIDPSAKSAAQTYGDNFGWEAIHWPNASWFLVNVPISSTESVQHVRNTVKGGWCKFTGLDASCWAVYNNNLYFATPDGYVQQISGTSDLGAFIPFRAIQAFNYFGSAHRKKQVTAVEVITNFAYPKYIDSKMHEDHNITTLPEYSAPPEAAVSDWNVGEWNVAEWSGGGAPGSKVSRKNIQGTGYALAHEVRWKSKAQSVTWFATHFFLKPMGIV